MCIRWISLVFFQKKDLGYNDFHSSLFIFYLDPFSQALIILRTAENWGRPPWARPSLPLAPDINLRL